MAVELEALARRWIELYNRQDADGMEEILDPEVRVVPTIAPIEEVMLGFDRFPRAYFRFMAEAFEYFELIPLAYTVRENRVLIDADIRTIGSGSGAEVLTRIHMVWEQRGGKLYRERTFRDAAEAAEALLTGDGLP